MIALGAALWYGCALWIRRAKYARSVPGAAIHETAAWMCVMGMLLSRAAYCCVNFDLFSIADGGWLRAFRLWEGGYSLCGALAGAILGMFAGAKRSGARPGRILNCFGPGLLAFSALACAAQRQIGEGWGKVTEAAWLFGTPLVVWDIYGEARYAVYRMEIAALALSFFAALISALRRGRRPPGDGLTLSAGLYALCMLVFSSMREGAVLRIEYIRLEQAFALVLVLGCVAGGFRANLRAGRGRRAAAAALLTLAGAALVTHMEFQVDREGSMEIKYACMAVGAIVCAHGAFLSRRKKR